MGKKCNAYKCRKNGSLRGLAISGDIVLAVAFMTTHCWNGGSERARNAILEARYL
jgi:hypothetical protein